ncbi:MAG: hypothetical protein HC911_03595 [Chloroflexaceae bacterium]|nr:hypothetical protein [Chloroflexaceae bacterium]
MPSAFTFTLVSNAIAGLRCPMRAIFQAGVRMATLRAMLAAGASGAV